MNTIFTLIIASQEVLDKFDTYHAFIQPIIKSPDLAMCKWNPTGETIEEALPALPKLLEGRDAWRAILIQDEDDMAQMLNPFDYMQYKEETSETKDTAYFEKRFQERCDLITRAVRVPYVHLSLLLGGVPKFSDYFIWRPPFMSDEEYEYLVKEKEEKSRIQTRLEKELEFPYKRPDELILIARRQRLSDDASRKIKVAWKKKHELEYSRFAESNMYPACGRFLVFDTVSSDHAEFKKEYFGFVMANMILGMNHMFSSQMQAYKLYRYECHINSSILGKALAIHQSQLLMAQAVVLQEQKRIEVQMQQKVHGMDLKHIIELDEYVPIEDYQHGFDELLSSYNQIGLANDCPIAERPYWNNQYIQIKSVLPLYLKGPKRAVREGIKLMHQKKSLDTNKLPLLDDFLMEDLNETIQNHEMNMEKHHGVDLSNIKELAKSIEEANQSIQNCMQTRMSKKTTLWIPLLAILLFCAGMLPTFFKSFSQEGTTAYYVWFMVLGSAMIAFCAYLLLFVFRERLLSRFRTFNRAVIQMDETVSESMRSYGVYLSSMCNCMRGYSYYYHLQNHSSLYQKQLEQLERHLIEILRRLENCKYWIRDFALAEMSWSECNGTCTLDLGIQPEENEYYQVELVEKGTTAPVNGNDDSVEIPYAFIDYVTVVREEVFDE